MRRPRIPMLLLLAALLLACNFPLFAQRPTPTSPASGPLETDTPSVPAPASFTPIAATATATIVPTPSVPVVTPNAANVNCRQGPDVAYNSVGVLASGSSTQVTGRSADSSWWYVRDPANQSGFCWIFSGVVTLSGPSGNIPVVAMPFAIATTVTVDVAIPTTIVCGGPNPVEFSGKITTNGAANVDCGKYTITLHILSPNDISAKKSFKIAAP